MKKLPILILIIFLTINVFAEEWTTISSPNPAAPTVKLVSCSEKEITVDFRLEGFYQKTVNTPHGLQQLISVPKMASLLKEGEPDLPLFAIPILIDDAAKMEIQIRKAIYKEYNDVEIAPSKGNLKRNINPEDIPYRYGETYSQDKFYPSCQTTLAQPYIMRDFRGQNILVYPFAYNPCSKTLRVYTQLTITLNKTDKTGTNIYPNRKSASIKIAPEQDAMYYRRFVNYKEKAAKYTFVPDVGEMIVICPPEYMEAMQPFIDWKNESGRPTTMVNLAEIGGNDEETIKTFIHSHYSNPEENLTYILLVGDYNDITPKYITGGRSDIWFGQLEGDDYYPEVFVGRFSVESIADVENQINKVIYYERDIDKEATWLNKGMGIGSTEGAGAGHNGGESDYQHIDYIRDTLLHYTYDAISRFYSGMGTGVNPDMLTEDFNNGVGICNYCNHGTQSGWHVGNFTNDHVNALTNDYKWPFIWSSACFNGGFSGNCFAEAWMRATNNDTGAPTGAIGGMFSWISQPWQPPMTGQDEMVDILCEWISADQYHHTLAGASLNGNMKILDLYPYDGPETHNTWILFGDPSLMLRTDIPSDMHVACQPETIFTGQTELIVTADADYAYATLSIDGKALASTAIINGEGKLTFAGIDTVGIAKLVVTGFNKTTEVKEIDIIPANGPYLICDGHTINDENGQADYGETLSLELSVTNIGNESTSDIQVQLATDSPLIDILDGMDSIPQLAPQEHYTLNGFLFTVNEAATDGAQIIFTITCTSNEETWTSSFRMTLHAPPFSLVAFHPLEPALPGETDTLILQVRNTSSNMAHNTQIQLYSSSTNLVLGQTLFHVGDMPSGSSVTLKTAFTPAAASTSNTRFEILYLIDSKESSSSGIGLLDVDIDDIPPYIIAFLPAIDSIEAQASNNQVTLRWQGVDEADHYFIRRNGIEIATQQETTFTETRETGTYVYSVSAVDHDGHITLPRFSKVTVSATGTLETTNDISLFPNPVHDILNVSWEQPFQYSIFNSLGQKVSSGNGERTVHIHCDDMAKGLYFIQISSSGQMFTRKILIY